MARNASASARSRTSSRRPPGSGAPRAFGFVIAAALLVAGCTGGGGSAPVVPQNAHASFAGIGAKSETQQSTRRYSRDQAYVDTVLGDSPLRALPAQGAERNHRRRLDRQRARWDVRQVDRAMGQSPASQNGPDVDGGRSSAGPGERGRHVERGCRHRRVLVDQADRGHLQGSPRIFDNAWTDHDGNGFMLWISNGTVAFNTGWSSEIATRGLKAGQVYPVRRDVRRRHRRLALSQR